MIEEFEGDLGVEVGAQLEQEMGADEGREEVEGDDAPEPHGEHLEEVVIPPRYDAVAHDRAASV